MSYKCIEFERRGAGAWVWINRPDALNAISPDLVDDLEKAMDEVEADPSIRAMIISGRGRAFSAGADLKFVKRALGGSDFTEFRAFTKHLMAVFNRLEGLSKPVIAAVNGLALAGGLELLLCCDLVIAAESARIGDAHANFGLLPGGGSSARLPRKIGVTKAKFLLYTGDFLPAQAMYEAGLVNQVVPDDQLVAATDKVVETLSKKSPLSIELVKNLVLDGMEQPLDQALRLELMAFEAYAHSHDLKEGLDAFNSKRTPTFNGT